jgi:hypothetical protein
LNYNRKGLVEAVRLAQNGSTDTVYFARDFIYTNNNSIAVKVHFQHDLVGSANITDFYNILSRMTTEDISIEQKEGYFHIKSGKAKAKLLMMDKEVSFPESDSAPLPSNFWKGLFTCLIPKNTHKLEGICVSDGYMMCTNGVQLNYHKLDSDTNTFWIKNRHIKISYIF